MFRITNRYTVTLTGVRETTRYRAADAAEADSVLAWHAGTDKNDRTRLFHRGDPIDGYAADQWNRDHIVVVSVHTSPDTSNAQVLLAQDGDRLYLVDPENTLSACRLLANRPQRDPGGFGSLAAALIAGETDFTEQGTIVTTADLPPTYQYVATANHRGVVRVLFPEVLPGPADIRPLAGRTARLFIGETVVDLQTANVRYGAAPDEDDPSD